MFAFIFYYAAEESRGTLGNGRAVGVRSVPFVHRHIRGHSFAAYLTNDLRFAFFVGSHKASVRDRCHFGISGSKRTNEEWLRMLVVPSE